MMLLIKLLLQTISRLPLTDVPSECGIKNTVLPLICHASETDSQYPWHAGLYKDDGKSFVCGGNIITDNAILTAAQCVHNRLNEPVATDDLRVAVGKFRRSWNVSDTNEQRFKVKSIFMPDTYLGGENQFADDIAVLLLDGTINITPKVMPVRIDWHNNYTVKASDFGTVVDWGITESEEPIEKLRVAKLPYYDFRSCRKEMSTYFSDFITSDKFCAGLHSCKHLGRWDAGAGITFPVDNKIHILHGIASISQEKSGIIGFTNVTYHAYWLDKILTAIKRSSSAQT